MMKALECQSKTFLRTLLSFSVLLVALLLSVWAHAGQVTLSWDANTEPDLAGYKLHYGTASGSYTVHLNVQNVTTYTVSGLTDGQTYYFAATAYDSFGNESGYSNEVFHSLPALNAAPSTPSIPSGPASAEVNTTIAFSTSAGDPNSDSVQYQTDTIAAGSFTDTGVTAEHLKPEAPVLVAPVSDAVVGVLAVLAIDSFKAAQNGAAHAKTRWQVFRDEDDSCVLDIQSATALTRLTVPKLVLDEGTPYFWRAQFIDADGTASTWSDYEYFVTATTDRDLNANGILEDQEVDSSVDLDKDGVKDNRQATIKSVKMEGTRVQIGVSIKGCPTAIAVESVESEDPRQPDAYASGKPRQMPFGLINFKIAVANPGDSAAVTLHFSEAAPARSKWFKYDPIADQWYDFSTHAQFAKDRRSITLSLQDGGAGDVDGIANGVIIDPAGVVELADTELPTGSSNASSGGGGGGCFIGSLSGDHDDIPWASWAGFLLLSLLVLAMGKKHRSE